MSSLEVKKIECKSCKGVDHKRSTNRLCPHSYWGKIRTAKRLEGLVQIKKSLKKFEEFILQKNITIDDLAPAFCSNWMEIQRYHGNRCEWKLPYHLQNFLFNLHYDIACHVYNTALKNDDILDVVSEKTKKIFGIVGSNAGDVWYNYSYTKAHYGTIILLNFWGVTIEARNEIL